MPKTVERDQELVDKSNLEITPAEPKTDTEQDEQMPDYLQKVELTITQIERLGKEVFLHYDKMKEQRTSAGLEQKWDDLDAQYLGQMEETIGLEFNLGFPITMVKVDALTRLALKAFLESDPKFAVTPRPETARQEDWEGIIEGQGDYLDYKLDEIIDIKNPLRQVIHQAANLDVGILKLPYSYERKKRKREETYSGKIKHDKQGQAINEGLNAFLANYPDALEEGNEGHWAFKKLKAGNDVRILADFDETTYNDPKPSFVDIRDFFTYLEIEGYEGLCNSQVTIERQKYSWWELKKKEKAEEFENVDEMKMLKQSSQESEANQEGQEIPDHEYQSYKVLEVVYWFDMTDNKDPDDEERIVCWFGEESKAFLGAIYYPYHAVESYYIPFYIKNKRPGFYKGGLAEDLTQSNLAQNAFLNFMLTESWMQLVTTPIVRENSTVASQFLDKRWKPGLPITIPATAASLKSELEFLDKKNTNVGQKSMEVMLFLNKLDDDRTGISSLASGKESPIDPRAPAAKTAMLLKQSGISIEDYIGCMLPSFNLVGEIVLKLTYQMSQGGRQYRQKQRAGMVTGSDIFSELTRDMMIAKTNIQSMAYAFNFDKVNEKQENLAYYQIMRSEGIVMQNPDAIYKMAKVLTKSWSPMWKNIVDQILPSPEQFEQMKMKLTMQALVMYLQQLKQMGEGTGVEQKPDIKQYQQMAMQMLAQYMTPAIAEEGKK